ncbi:MAG TPA: AbrB/MazE/SpoVT family DNA-binding domain-containing protein [Thermoanaerobaculia bacterium]|jgi:AbrB family looped-hinge helix DNA binding protein
MGSLATTKLSSKGQVVIPEEIPQKLGLKEGTQFVVVGDRDVVVLKSIPQPAMEEFDELVDHARRAAAEATTRRLDTRRAMVKRKAS